MSRIGKQPIKIPEEVTVTLAENEIQIKGPKGELKQKIFPQLKVEIADNQIVVSPKNKTDKVKALHGLARSLIANFVQGVTKGYERRLELVGTGYRVKKEGEKLTLSLGFSHPVIVEPFQGISLDIEGEKKIIVKGIDKQKVGQMAASIRSLRKPEPYKGKGIRYEAEVIRLKPGKAAKVGAAAGATGGA